MNYEVNRMQTLAGLMTESKSINELEAKVVLTPENPEEAESLSAMPLDPEDVEVEEPTSRLASPPEPDAPAPAAPVTDEMDPALEESLRSIIRSEMQAVLSEMANKEHEAVVNASKEKSLKALYGGYELAPEPAGHTRGGAFLGTGFEKK